MTLTNTPIEKFDRYEFKYLLNRFRLSRFEAEIRHFMTYDGHIHPELDNKYFVRSLYFDNDQASNYYEKIDGLRTRRKFRIRTYDIRPNEGLLFFLEEKGRHNERTYKTRIQIAEEHVGIFLDPNRHDVLLNHYPGVALIERFVADCMRRALKPKVLVDYKRRPYTSEYDMNFRVTLDSDLRAAATNRIFPSETASWRESDAGYTIVEIKFFRRIPAWFHRTLQTHNLRRLSISKFCRGMEVSNLAVNLE